MTGKPFSEERGGEIAGNLGLRGLIGWQQWQGILRSVLMATLTVSVLAVLFWHVEPAAIVDAARRLPTGVWAICLCIAFIFPLVSTTRWWVMTRAMGSAQPWPLLLRAWLGISPVNLIAPSKSGDLLRIVALRGRMEGSRVVAGLLAERTLDLAILASFVLMGGILSGRAVFTGLSLVVFLAVFAVIAIALSGARLPTGKMLAPRVAAFAAALREGLGKPALLAAATVLTVVQWTLVGALVTIMLLGSGADINAVDTMIAMPMAVLTGMIPITIAGMGTRDGTMLVLYAGVANPSQILAAGLLYTAIVYWLPALTGLVFTRSVLQPQRGSQTDSHCDPSRMRI